MAQSSESGRLLDSISDTFRVWFIPHQLLAQNQNTHFLRAHVLQLRARVNVNIAKPSAIGRFARLKRVSQAIGDQVEGRDLRWVCVCVG